MLRGNMRVGAGLRKVLAAEGHSPEQLCFYCESKRLLLSGDDILYLAASVAKHRLAANGAKGKSVESMDRFIAPYSGRSPG
jgi:glyoxylase-like metal-dependent hydrolase (beta-lactamase superfamily II)